MSKTLTYSSLVLASLIVCLIFVTAKTYPQLLSGIVLYPVLITASLGVFPRGTRQPIITANKPQQLNQQILETSKPQLETTYISDIDKRAFIKLIGATGISFFLFSLFGKSFENLLFNKIGQPQFSTNSLLGNNNQPVVANTSSNEGYHIAEIDEGTTTYYGFTNKQGAWQIMREDPDGNSFRYAKGGSNFPGNWANRENLNYDYFYNLS